MGDYAEPHHESQPRGTGWVVRQAVEGETDLLAKPVDFVKIWVRAAPCAPSRPQLQGLAHAISATQDSRKTGARYGDVSFWRPVPPAGYVALGDVTNANNDQKPSKDSMRYTVHWGSKAQPNDSDRQARWWW